MWVFRTMSRKSNRMWADMHLAWMRCWQSTPKSMIPWTFTNFKWAAAPCRFRSMAKVRAWSITLKIIRILCTVTMALKHGTSSTTASPSFLHLDCLREAWALATWPPAIQVSAKWWNGFPRVPSFWIPVIPCTIRPGHGTRSGILQIRKQSWLWCRRAAGQMSARLCVYHPRWSSTKAWAGKHSCIQACPCGFGGFPSSGFFKMASGNPFPLCLLLETLVTTRIASAARPKLVKRFWRGQDLIASGVRSEQEQLWCWESVSTGCWIRNFLCCRFSRFNIHPLNSVFKSVWHIEWINLDLPISANTINIQSTFMHIYAHFILEISPWNWKVQYDISIGCRTIGHAGLSVQPMDRTKSNRWPRQLLALLCMLCWSTFHQKNLGSDQKGQWLANRTSGKDH